MKTSHIVIVLAVLVSVGLVSLAAIKGGVTPESYSTFAQCLTDKGVKMYGAWWCPHCQAQKKLFGSSFDKITYVECSNPDKSMNQVCQDAGVTGYPTWKFADGTIMSGEQTFVDLGARAECQTPVEPE